MNCPIERTRKILLDILEKKERIKRRFVNPEKYINKLFFRRMGYPLDLENPKTYNEKLQWMKLYWHLPILTDLVDKYVVKDYVVQRIGKEYVIPTIAVWDNPSEIDWNVLPQQFVIKCTHDSGGLVICKDKTKLNRNQALRILKSSFRNNYYYDGFEWPYKNVKPRILVEQYLEDSITKELCDYKFFCFDGQVKALFVATDRNKPGVDVKFDFFDSDFNHLPFKQGHDNAPILPKCPNHFEEMKQIASVLSKGFPHVRVDLYEVNGRVYFGEMTFFHHGGWTSFDPDEWDSRFGEWLTLPLDKVI